jgi:hypothetical protein
MWTGALPAQKTGSGDLFGIVNGMVVQVETYLGKTAGPAQLRLELFGGTVCNVLNQCTSIAGGMEAQQYMGQRLLIAVETNPERQTLRPVGAINGVIRLTETGWGVVDPMLATEEKVEWERYLGQAPRLAPVAGAAAPAGGGAATEAADPRRNWSAAPVALALLALAGGVWHWRRRTQA